MALYTDDVKMFADLIRDNWSLEFNKVPNIYYNPNQLARNNVPSSIFIYGMTRSNTRVGINYEAVKRTRRISIDLQTPENRELHYEMCEELYRILMKFRRAGKAVLGGWDYYDVNNDDSKQNFTSYYSDSFDVNLVSEITIIESPGFGNIDDSISKDDNTIAEKEVKQ